MAEGKKATRKAAMWWTGWFCVAVLLLGTLLYLFYLFPRQDLGPVQPIYFSHRIHAGVKQINCRFCHPYVERSEHAGLPEVEKCFFCHKYIIPMHPEILKEKEYLDKKVPVPWVRIYFVPDFVKFRHQPHMIAQIDCLRCHGDVPSMDRLRRVDFQMNFCITCHEEKHAQLDCYLGCHH
ncbi:MAG: cytochrome c3 family protein [Syntrophobacteraceae bacterium]